LSQFHTKIILGCFDNLAPDLWHMYGLECMMLASFKAAEMFDVGC